MEGVRDIRRVLDQLPHRYPFLLVDRVISNDQGKVWAIKNVTFNEPFFHGHFPGQPVMPGVLILEALAQASIFLLQDQINPGQVVYLAGIEHARFRRQVVPGDRLDLHAEMVYFRRGVGRGSAFAEVDGERAAEADILFSVGHE